MIVDKTDGVPLYVEEMTKSILESGALKETTHHYELSGPIALMSIPITLPTIDLSSGKRVCFVLAE